jgi:amidohydrolase
MSLKDIINQRITFIKEIREQLHDNAELAFDEHKTREIIIGCLKEIDSSIDIKNYAGTGLAAVMNNGESCIAVRADMDALPINGVFHGCGHDYHMAVSLGVAQVLKDIGYKNCIKFIFQPAEEGSGGALPMIEEGVLENPIVTNVIGFHVWPEVPVGQIEVSPGPSMASVDDFHITFTGKGGHAAMPYKCLNPIYPSIDFIETINIKSRIEQDPLNPHIITVSSIQSGSAPNVIADTSKVLGTVRTFDSVQRHKLYEEIDRTAKLSADKYNCSVDVHYEFQYPPLISEKNLTENFISTTKSLIGSDNVKPLEKTFAAEDFSFFAEKVPSVHFRLGICDGEKGMYPLHSPHFDVHDESLYYGIYIITNFIISLEKGII